MTALEQAIGSGALTVKYEDRLVTYRSLADLLHALEIVKASLGLLPSGLTNDVRAISDKGGL